MNQMDNRRPISDVTPEISALVCTRNRGGSIVPTVRSILGNEHPSFELVVVDQSSNDDTARAIEQFSEDPRLSYVRSNTVGLGVAHNVGLAHARADIVAMTDDDCEVDNNWMQEIVAVFAQNPRVAVVYCNVVPVMADPSLGFVPSYVASSSRLMTQMRDFCAPHGIERISGVRKVLMEKGGFRQSARFGRTIPLFEDSTWPCALATATTHHTHKTNIRHTGFRTWEEGRVLAKRDCLGIGAGYAKLLKCGVWQASLPCGYEFAILVLLPFIKSIVRLRKPPVLVRSVSLAQGFWHGMRTPVDRSRLLFRLRSSA
jgi:glycosyltransferase involved in cell wall biosynthesis